MLGRMIREFETVAALVALIAAATLLARRWRVQPSILLVVTGVALAFVPGLPDIRLDPDTVLLVVLPPLIYSAGVATSWPDFRSNLSAITLLAVGAVAFTTGLVAIVAHYGLGMAWAPAMLLGAVISPPDVIAPMALVGRLRIPRRLVTILNGEGLVNDVTALVLVGVATDAVVRGDLSAPRAAALFGAVLVGELAWGLVLGWATLHVRRWSDDVRVEITLSLLTPFVAFWPPHWLGGSGVLAAAVAGQHAGWVGPRMISAATRLQGTFFWNLTVYLLTGLVFLLTGLQARNVLAGLGDRYGWAVLAFDAAAICLVAVVARFGWVFMSVYTLPVVAGRDKPGWRQPFLVAFTGIRGVVSLVAALSIPLAVAGGGPFPNRDLIVFLTFAVIVATLVVQGPVLPFVIRRLGLDSVGEEESRREENSELATLVEVEVLALSTLEPAATRMNAPPGVADDLRTVFEGRRRRAERARDEPDAACRGRHIELAVIETQRTLAWTRFTDAAITDEARRRIEHELDLEEARIRRAPNEAIPDGN